MAENKEYLSPLEQMNQILTEKEKVIDAKMEELKSYRLELDEFEKQLSQKAAEVKQAQEEIALEKKSIEKKWNEIENYEKNLETSMAYVMAEKVELEKRSVSDLESLLNGDDILAEKNKSSEFDLNALRQSVGIDVKESITSDVQENVPNFGTKESDIPKVLLQIEKEVSKSYPKWVKLELLPERYCVQCADKEIRFFDADERNPVPRVEIIVFRKNARADKRLINNIAGIERIAPDWSIEVEDNQLVCTMQFTVETKPAVVLKKSSDFISKHLN